MHFPQIAPIENADFCKLRLSDFFLFRVNLRGLNQQYQRELHLIFD